MLLDYATTNPVSTIRYKASDMCLHVESDAAYLVLPKARSRLGGHFYLSDKITSKTTTPTPTPNGPIHNECKTIRNVMSSAAEAEAIGIYHNSRTAVPIRTALEELGHPQPPTIIKTDNSTAHGILNSKIRQKRSKAFDMNVYWIKDRIKQNQFKIHWERGKNNKADYFTKHFAPKHHKSMRYIYLQPPTAHQANAVNSLVQGCVTTISQYSTNTKPLEPNNNPAELILNSYPDGEHLGIKYHDRINANRHLNTKSKQSNPNDNKIIANYSSH